MNTIQQAYINALLADASYRSINAAMTSSELEKEIAPRLTQPQASFLAANFQVVASIETPNTLNSLLGTGFDAVVWKGKTGTDYAGQTYVSMRGTQGGQDISDDVSMAGRGIPYEQVRDMVNWWLKATAKAGDVVKQVALQYGPGVPGAYTFIAGTKAAATGELYGKVGSITSVNGHSLGGYLATAFTRLFGANVAELQTFNSAGFSDAAGSNIKAEFDNLETLLGSALLGTGGFDNVGLKQTNYRAGNGVSVAALF